MNKAIYNRLPEEFRVLYELSYKKRIDGGLRRELRDKVKELKEELLIKAGFNNIDELHEKLRQYGNKGKWSSHKIHELERLIFNSKKPGTEDLGQWVSVEIECIMPDKSSENKFIKFIRSKGLTKYVTVKDDGSLHPSHDERCESETRGDECNCDMIDQYGREIIVTFKFGDWNTLETVCQGLATINASVNKTCGLHVHFDCRGMSARQVTTIGKRLARCVPALKTLLPKSRQNNSYCADPINGHRGGDRYSFVNLKSFRKHQTLEVRGHSGTTDANKMINWIKLLKVIMAKKGTAEVKDFVGLIFEFKLTDDLKEYVTERYTKFNKAKAVKDDVAQDNETRMMGLSEQVVSGEAARQRPVSPLPVNFNSPVRFNYTILLTDSTRLPTDADINTLRSVRTSWSSFDDPTVDLPPPPDAPRAVAQPVESPSIVIDSLTEMTNDFLNDYEDNIEDDIEDVA